MITRVRSSAWIAVAIAVGASLLVLRPVLAMHAPPAYSQDWAWPVTPASLPDFLAFAFSAWHPTSLGVRNIYPSFAPLWVIEYLVMIVFGLTGGVKILLVGIFVSAALGATRLARIVARIPWCDAALAGVVYVGLPAFSDKLVAGHLGVLVAWAALPIALGALAEDRLDRPLERWICILATLWCGVQVQFLIVAPFVLLLFLGAFSSPRRVATFALAMAALTLANATSIVQLLTSYATTPWLSAEHTILQWEYAQSVAFPQMLFGTGYFAGYDRIAGDPTFAVFRAVALAAVVAALVIVCVTRRTRVWAAIAVIYLAGVAIIANLRGPLHEIAAFLYTNVTAASAFRETFHMAALVVLPLGLAAAAVPSLTARFGRHAEALALVLTAIVVVSASSLSLTGTIAGELRPYPAADLPSAAAMRALPQGARVVVTPINQPVASSITGTSGLDPITAYPLDGRWTVRGYPQTGLTRLATFYLASGQLKQAEALLGRVSAGEIVVRNDPTPGFYQVAERGSLLSLPMKKSTRIPAGTYVVRHDRPLVFGSGVPLLVGGDFTRLLDRSSDGRIVAFMRQAPSFVHSGARFEIGSAGTIDRQVAAGCRSVVNPSVSHLNAWPTTAWIDAGRVALQDERLAAPVTPSVVSQMRRPLPPFALPTDAMLVASLSGTTAGFAWRRKIPAAPGAAIAVSAGVTRVHGQCTLPAEPRSRGSIRVLSWTRQSNVRLTGTLDATGGDGAIELTDAFDPGWQLTIDGTAIPHSRHFAADGTANGWDLTIANGPHHFIIEYRPARLFDFLQGLGCGIWIFAFIGFLYVAITRQRQPGEHRVHDTL